jgi:hypothetical protein
VAAAALQVGRGVACHTLISRSAVPEYKESSLLLIMMPQESKVYCVFKGARHQKLCFALDGVQSASNLFQRRRGDQSKKVLQGCKRWLLLPFMHHRGRSPHIDAPVCCSWLQDPQLLSGSESQNLQEYWMHREAKRQYFCLAQLTSLEFVTSVSAISRHMYLQILLWSLTVHSKAIQNVLKGNCTSCR